MNIDMDSEQYIKWLLHAATANTNNRCLTLIIVNATAPSLTVHVEGIGSSSAMWNNFAYSTIPVQTQIKPPGESIFILVTIYLRYFWHNWLLQYSIILIAWNYRAIWMCQWCR